MEGGEGSCLTTPGRLGSRRTGIRVPLEPTQRGSMEMSPFLVTGQEGEERGQRGIPRTTGAFPSSVLAPSLYGAVFWGALLPLAGSDLEGPLWAPLSLPPGCGQALAQVCTLQRAGGVVLNK